MGDGEPGVTEMKTKGISGRVGFTMAALVLVHSVYLLVSGSPSILYVSNVLLHVPVGVVALVLIVSVLRRVITSLPRPVIWLCSALVTVSIAAGVFVAVKGNTTDTRSILALHAVTGLALIAVTIFILVRTRSDRLFRLSLLTTICLVTVIAVVLLDDRSSDSIENEILPPLTMADAAMGGADGPFFPSPAATADGNLIPSEYFTDSESCGRSGCHVNALDQWSRSAHRFSSFNNQWYRKSIEYMQQVVGTTSPQWCAGCHDHALLFAGKMAAPVSDFLETEAAQAGLGCISCHAITEVKNTGGNGAIVIDYPRLHDLATSDNPIVQTLHDLTLHLDPEPHRRSFFKPFHVEQSAEFCSACHKVHLDEPVNNYRWIRGFNTYDNWQASGVSHQGARSFYQPEAPLSCASCHMPPTRSEDPGNDDGTIRSHEFVAANTALAVANQDDIHLASTTAFLEAKQLRVDIFAISKPGQSHLYSAASIEQDDPVGRLATTFASGDEKSGAIGAGSATTTAVEVFAPLEDGMPVLSPSTTVRLDVVVRTLGLGHFFPTGTVDAQEAWLEVSVKDEQGEIVFWSGRTNDEGFVDPSAHFYRSLMIDERGNPIDKRNAFASRSVIYVNLIPPGSADVGHFVFNVPSTVTELSVEAKLNYRKFSKAHSLFAYAGIMDDASGEYGAGFDDREWAVSPVSNVSGVLQDVPEVPIVVMASDSVLLRVGEMNDRVESEFNFERWTDYGIGLFRSGDLRGALAAFKEATEIYPDRSDAWVNEARVLIEEGDIEAAQPVLVRALELDGSNQKAQFFSAVASKAIGDYDEALRGLTAVSEMFPRDRVVLNQMGRVLFLMERFDESIDAFRSVLRIDAEDLMAHYNLMLAYRATGNNDASVDHQRRYERYKDDERSHALALEYRQRDAFANNEAQSVHFHRSVTESEW